jgi:SRSO17 transposase
VSHSSWHGGMGCHSVGVARQWCGRLGKVDNCQVGVFMGYASRTEQALVDMRLYLSKEWAKDRKRRKKSGIPKQVRYQTRHELALDMLEEKGDVLPHAWITGDDEMGRPAWFRRELSSAGEQYLLAVPSNTTIRDLEAEAPPYSGRGAPRKPSFKQVRNWCQSLLDEAWTQVEVRDAEKGPLVLEVVKRPVVARIDRKIGPEETLVVTRTMDEQGTVKYDYYLSNASSDTPLGEFARVANAAHRIEECIKRGKSEAGMADYQVRTWRGWHHHITLSLIATWFLIGEARRGKKMDAGNHGSTGPRTFCPDPTTGLGVRHARSHQSRMHTPTRAQRTRKVLSPSSA